MTSFRWSGPGARPWLVLVLWMTAILAVIPLLLLLPSWLSVDTEIWRHLWQTQLAELIGNTLILLIGVGVGVCLLAIPLAWLVAACEFPGRSFFDWALILPLAIPAYVLAFVTLGFLDFGGPLQMFLRSIGMTGYFDARHPLLVIWVMSAVLYPYVYLLLRAAFITGAAGHLEVARGLGLGPFSAFFKVVLPSVRPALVAGLTLALMETLADFGAVSILGFNSFTTAIYKSWFSLFSLQTAAQLASLLLLFVFLLVFSERFSRGRAPRQEAGASPTTARIRLVGPLRYLASGFCALILGLTLVLPLLQLLSWSGAQLTQVLAPDFIQLLGRTLALGAVAALLVIGVALLCALADRAKRSPLALECAGIGYALPGSVLAIGVMLMLSSVDHAYLWLGSVFGLQLSPMLLGSLTGLLLAYFIRFFRPGLGAILSALGRLRESSLESAQLLGVTGWRRFLRVTLPLVVPGILTAALIVFVDVAKEMPASLLLRPFGWDTLAIKIYELTAEGEWQRAALPALVLLLLSLGPVALLIRQSRIQQG